MSTVKALAGPGSGEGPLPGLQMANFSWWRETTSSSIWKEDHSVPNSTPMLSCSGSEMTHTTSIDFVSQKSLCVLAMVPATYACDSNTLGDQHKRIVNPGNLVT